MEQSETQIKNTGAPREYILFQMLFFIYTNEVQINFSNCAQLLIKIADDMTFVARVGFNGKLFP